MWTAILLSYTPVPAVCPLSAVKAGADRRMSYRRGVLTCFNIFAILACFYAESSLGQVSAQEKKGKAPGSRIEEKPGA